MKDYSNMVVAFGATDTEYCVSAGMEYEESDVPHDLSLSVASNISRPIVFVSFSPKTTPAAASGWYAQGYKPGQGTEQSYWERIPTGLSQDMSSGKFALGVSIGLNNAYAFWTAQDCYWSNLGDIRGGWVEKMRKDYPSKRIKKIFLGADNAIVLVWTDDTFCVSGVVHNLNNVAIGAAKKGLRIRHVSMSLANPAYFFVQFTDNSVTWWASDKLRTTLLDFARGASFLVRKTDLGLDIVP